MAGVKYFGHSADYQSIESIEDIFSEVERARTTFGVVPVENSIEGAVFSTLDSFMKHKVKICGEVNLEISHNLVCQSGNIEDIKTVASHSQPLAQCREWQPPQLQVVVSGIEDYRGNTTRFLVIGKKSPSRSGNDKTSLLIGLLDRPGALNEALSILADKGINLAKIESRPIKGMQWKYLFFMDMVGHMEDKKIKEGCTDLQKVCSYYEWLGSYPMTEDDNN
ncbi:MAG: prephenate dehydratase domain-containing protein [Desulfobulbaceae bacterium]